MCCRPVDWVQDYQRGESPEALLLKDLDKFDMIFQAYEYETGINPLLTNDAHMGAYTEKPFLHIAHIHTSGRIIKNGGWVLTRRSALTQEIMVLSSS